MPVGFRLLSLFVLLLTSAGLSAAVVKGVQRGTAVSSGNGVVTVGISAVDPAKSFLVFQTRSSSNRPPGSMIIGRLNAGGTAVEFVRTTNETSTIDIQWSVVEFLSGVSVQRGEVNQTSTTVNVPITPVASTGQAFVLWSKVPGAGHYIWSMDDPILGELTSTSNLQFRVNQGSSGHVIAWQVVEFTSAADINVQKGSTSLLGSNASVDITLPTPVDVSKAFVLTGFRSASDGPDVGERMIRAQIINSNTLRIDRSRTGDNLTEIVWQVVELKDGSSVQRGSERFNAGVTQRSVSISPVDTSRAVAFASVQAAAGQSLGRTAYNLDDIIGEASVTLGLSSASIDMRRNSARDFADIGWFVVEFNSTPAVTLPNPVADWRLDEMSWNGTAGEVVDSSGNGLDGIRVGSATPVPAKVCNGASLNGSSDYLQIADNNLLDITSTLTVMAWVRPDVIPASGLKSIISKDENFEFHINTSGNIYWWWHDSGGTSHTLTSSGAPLSPGNWYHVAIVYDASGSQMIYIDGVERASSTRAESLRTNADPLQIGADQGFPGRQFDGLIDEARVYDSALSAAQVAVAMNETHPCPTQRLAYYPMDEASWSGLPGEVTDASGSGNHGVRVGAAQTVINGKVCRAGEVVNEGDAIDSGVDLDTTVGPAGTVSLWFRPNWSDTGTQRTRDRVLFDASLGNKYFKLAKRQAMLSTNTRLILLFEDSIDSDFSVNADVPRLNSGSWVHIATTWDYGANRYQIYFNGAVVADVTRSTNGNMPNFNSLYFGDNRTGYNPYGITRVADASFDEARIDSRVLSQAEIQADMNATHPCVGTLDHFVITHDGHGINCLAETVTVMAAAADGSTVTTYTGSISLDTQTGTGSWSLNTGSGGFADVVADDGLATYQFTVADAGVASFDLDYRSGPASIDVDVFEGVIRDDDTEGSLLFSPSGFVVTAAPLSNPPPAVIDLTIAAQTAASDFPLYLAAYGQTSTDPVCGIIEAYDGVKNLNFWSSYNDPVTGTLPVLVDSNAIAGSEAASAVQSVTFVQGQAAISVNYADVGDIDIAMKDDTTGNPSLPTGIRGASQPFVVRPAGFVLSNIVRTGDGFANPVATNENDLIFIAAGSPFSVTVTAVNSLGNATPNYGQETTPESVLLTSTLVAAGGASNPPLGFTTGFGSFANGVATGTDFSWGEVGIITLTPSVGDGNYLGGGDVTGTVSGNIGRFTPFDFNVVLDNSPAFATTCGSFTYMGQAFNYSTAPQVTIAARNSTGAITQNYDNNWWKLADFSESYAHNGSLPATASLDASGAGHAAISCSNCAGTVTTTFNGSLSYTTSTLETLPFNGAVNISFPITDGDGISYAGNPFTISAIGFDAGSEQRSGQGFAQDVYGTYANIGDALSMPVGTQYYSAASTWLNNSADSCTSYSYVKADSGISTTVTPVSPVSMVAGNGDLAIQLTGDSGDPGGVATFTFTWPSWLTGTASATATFGIFRGDDRFLYWREAP